MEDKTPLYMMLIVALVAVVGLIIVLTHSGPSYSSTTEQSSDLVTGNVTLQDMQAFGLNTFGKVFFILFLAGIAAYMYFRKDN